ncbi:hypothetical protein CANTEDRAFT_130275 [Yamadazyma tenuis ATCC 10573]|uniref:Zn(2)-C6 fungal-type domain-containing protein n=1 Tax=Candida tenuis (strain ATCC 10573 / BCRC 21748 / CBS 615 / JCM 9827 / NBRC 10315 / NRRL Y-1498 / VKM Y-70) TaxID=590646 RepID=G3B402_CANTC|nr:uncharacterized protein CANTEDRAFT_130275 [Yamadazyma tenuis ATCC 10573]EGV63903.1 hypothetical protein CANTEDRAFT_130275 [Yamadazyma tenuis ATCC 10573]
MENSTSDSDSGRGDISTTYNTGRVTKPPPSTSGKISKSCDHCKLKKIKCDQKKPTCVNCVKYGETCIYSVMKKPGLRSGYGQQVFERIEELDNFLEEKFDTLEKRYTGPSVATSSTIRPIPLNFQSTGTDPMNLSTTNPTITPNSALISAGPGPMFTRNNSSNNYTPNTNSAISPPEDIDSLPPLDKIEVLVELYFELVNPVFPILHPTLDRPRILKTIDTSNFLLLGVLVSTVKLQINLFSPQEAERYFAFIKSKIVSSCFAVRTIQELRAVALLAFTLYGESNNHEAWSMISLAVGGCLHLGIIKDFPLNNDLLGIPQNELVSLNRTEGAEWEVWAEKESIRYLMWEVYKLDKLSSMGSHFVSKLPQEEVSSLLPLKADFWEFKSLYNKALIEKEQTHTLNDFNFKPGNRDIYGSNCYLIQVLNLMGRGSKFRGSPMDIKDMGSILAWQLGCYEFEKEIQAWKSSLPDNVSQFLDSEILMSSQITVKDVILHSLYHTMIIRLHSPTAFSDSQDKYLISAQTSKAKCLKSAHLILKISKSLPSLFQIDEESVFPIFGPYYAFSIWVSGRVILVDAIHSQGQLEGEFDYAISLLRRIGQKWECAAKYANILEFFKDDTMTVDTSSHDGTGEFYSSNSYSEDARLIADIKLNASSLDSLLSKKVARYKNAKGNIDDLSIFDWFKLPLNNVFMPSQMY